MGMTNKYQQLMQLPLFQGISPEKITALVEKLPFHFLKFNNGEQIVAAGAPCTHVKFVVSGCVRLTTPFSTLRIALHQSLMSPHVLAPDCLFGLENCYPYSAVSVGVSGILQLRKSDYIKMVGSDKVFLFNILNYLSTGSQRGPALTVSMKSGSVAERLAMMLNMLVVNGATDISLTYKQKDLCAMLCTQRATIISAMDKLAEEGLLEYDSKQLNVLDFNGLINRIN